MLHSLSLCARVTLNLHNLNSEGTEGNQQQTRMVHILDETNRKCVVNAVSGDMFKHIFVEHLTPLLVEAKQTVCANALVGHPDRILLDPSFQSATPRGTPPEEVLRQMITRCAVTDIAGALHTDTATARKSVVEFGWVVGVPEHTRTEQYFHVKFDPSRASGTGTETVAGSQAIFHRPASSGCYALVCHVELDRIGVNDVSRQLIVDKHDKKERVAATLKAVAATLISPRGAQRNTQHPHITGAEGVIAVSRNCFCAPTVSPLNREYRVEMKAIIEQLKNLSRISDESQDQANTSIADQSAQSKPKPEVLELYEFESLSEALRIFNTILEDKGNGMVVA
ncbi:MAG: DevR family CRISPR-associated autoregulator [Armatimonadota bacterium]|nr:DevR family CRISPR-associated autoregulator [Armatimonadota bacterium]